jgi:hypothetical protein
MSPGISAKEVNVNLTSFKASVDKQFAAVDKVLYLLIGIGLTIVGVGFAFQREIASIEQKLDNSASQISAIERRLEKIETNVDAGVKTQLEAKALQGDILAVLGKISDNINNSPIQIFPLTEDDKKVIREFFGIDRGPSRFKPKYLVGQFVTGAVPIADELVAKLPKLSGLKTFRDPENGSVLLVGDLGRIVSIVAPA